jgi:hypothetical protein
MYSRSNPAILRHVEENANIALDFGRLMCDVGLKKHR